MDPKHLTGIDERLLNMCAYCGGQPESRDHVPSRVLLDEPYPADLAVVEACHACNNSFSKAELYVACLVECVLAGTTDPTKITRKRIARALYKRPHVEAAIASSRLDNDPPLWQSDAAMVDRVGLKLSQGHAVWDLSLPALGEPSRLVAVPLPTMSPSARTEFERTPSSLLWPELGSRQFYSITTRGQRPGWVNVQPGRYRYQTYQGDSTTRVRIVLSEYLGYEAVWE